MATNWDEAGREETSPENDYTNNEVRDLLHPCEPHLLYLLTSTYLTIVHCAKTVSSNLSRHLPEAHGQHLAPRPCYT